MLTIPSTISNECLARFVTHLRQYVPAMVLVDKQSIIRSVNDFLARVDFTLCRNNVYHHNNWHERGRLLYAFSSLFIDILTNSRLDEPIRQHFCQYMCQPNECTLVPMRHLYKVLTNIALLHLDDDPEQFFYIYENTSKPMVVNTVLEYMFSPDLRYAKTDVTKSLNLLQSKDMAIIRLVNQYLIVSLELRKYYISEQICGKMRDEQHTCFIDELCGLMKALEYMMKQTNDYALII